MYQQYLEFNLKLDSCQAHVYDRLTPHYLPDCGALFLAALVANCFLGALPPVDLRAVCFVRAILFAEK